MAYWGLIAIIILLNSPHKHLIEIRYRWLLLVITIGLFFIFTALGV